MSTIHFSAAELANIVSVLEVRHYDNRAKLVKTMSEVATVNAFAVNAAYKMNEPTVTATEIEAAAHPVGASLERAIATCTMLRYNCDGFMNDRLAAEVGVLCGQLARKAMERLNDRDASVVHLQRKLSEADKEIAALKVKPARKPRAVKGA
jgi:hypothetical protein